jgi:hypothetical protein
MGLFSSSSSKKTYATTTQTQDMRTAVEGNVGTLIAPGAAVASGQGVSANVGAGATLSQNITNTGMASEDVATIVGLLQEDRASERQSVSTLGQSLATSLAANAERMSDIVEAAKTPESAQFKQIAILVAVLFVVWALVR